MLIMVRLTEDQEVVVEDELGRLEKAYAKALKRRRPLKVRLPIGQDMLLNPDHVLLFQLIWVSDETTPDGRPAQLAAT
jgi:hypothetical protein